MEGDIPEVEKSGLTFINLVGIKDSVKSNVGPVLANWKKGGMKTIMITGDNIITAKAIALDCGLITEQ